MIVKSVFSSVLAAKIWRDRQCYSSNRQNLIKQAGIVQPQAMRVGRLRRSGLDLSWLLCLYFLSPLSGAWLYVLAPSLSHVWLFATLWTVACQASLSMGFSRQDYWSIAISSSRDLPDPDIEPVSPVSLALAGRFFTTSATWEALFFFALCKIGLVPPTNQ